MKLIAIPTRDSMVDDHFGHCAYYTVVTLDEQNQVVKQERLNSPEGCGCKSNIASVMQEMGITLMLAGNMGMGAFRTIVRQEIKREMMQLKLINNEFSVCKVVDYSEINLNQEYVFTGSTDEEKSLVCPISLVPGNTIEREDGWRAFRIEGVLDFSLIGILSKISSLLAANKIGIFAISTFNTDYILTKKEDFDKAIDVLKAEGYLVK